MAEASAVPWDWDYQTNINSTNVEPVVNEFNGLDDLGFTFAEVG